MASLPHDVAELPEALDRELVTLYRSWDAMERTENGLSVIDFDLADSFPVEPANDRQQVLSRIEGFLDQLQGLEAPVEELVRARLTASRAYLRALLGEELPFDEYIERTLDLRPREFDEAEIDAQRDVVNEYLSDRDLRLDPSSAARFDARFLIRAFVPGSSAKSRARFRRSLSRQFDFFRLKWKDPLFDWLGVSMLDYEINVEFDEEDAYWKNWISGELGSHEIDLRINIHERHEWYLGSPEILVLHEYYGHALQMILWHQRIQQGLFPQFYGILTVHFPEQFTLEGLAESLVHFVTGPERLEGPSEMFRELRHYDLLVMNNVHILANKTVNDDEAFAYARKRLPFTSDDTIRREIRDRRSHPLFRGYQYVYPIGLHSFLEAGKKLDPKSMRQLLQKVYTRPMTAPQFYEWVGALSRSERDDSA